MKTKTKKQSTETKVVTEMIQPVIKTETVQVKVAKDPKQITGLRGLKSLVFDRFAQAFAKGKELPSCEELTKEVKEKFPMSRWMASEDRQKVHYSYYKSKFMSAMKA